MVNTKLQNKLRKLTAQAVTRYAMIEDGDRVMVCLSGGKDSYTMLDNLLYLQKVAPISFEVFAVNLDQKQPGFPAHILPEYLTTLGIEHYIVNEDTYSIVKEKTPEGKTTCALCSRLRRAILYKTAKQHKATKIALGHHRDDMLETLLLNMFHGGKLKSMPPKLVSDNGEQIVIRPLAFCAESDIAQYSESVGYPIIPCNLCGSQENLQRKQIKLMLQDWHERFPTRIASMATSLQQVVPSHLADDSLYDFTGITTTGEPVIDGDIGFDEPQLENSAIIELHTTNNSVDNSKIEILEIK
ncbi:MAG: tRNA 2-thiocytidine(32) synthetase TtcA [Glaciecola sp.]|jgi:tRNA 2-thiocytidine biosynthesis protein TtcA|nr:tRNA 2-thiocytidine(32) synthetase TtcA [Glaciecola sp.]MDG1814830.1 tRNA 2-thiocytidine(32) synthetase TtcA [Glaciecola sp.]MDG2098975.1 tRNA 2-thiocytidine(32) synthetase TtcA [Glaciecola sp.]